MGVSAVTVRVLGVLTSEGALSRILSDPLDLFVSSDKREEAELADLLGRFGGANKSAFGPLKEQSLKTHT